MMEGILKPEEPKSKQGNLILKALRTLKGISKGPDGSSKVDFGKDKSSLEDKK